MHREPLEVTPPLDAPPLEAFKDRHVGRRCFVVGNGPSLAQLDLTKLRGELAFTVNRGYLAADFGLPVTDYYAVSDGLTYDGYAAEIRAAAVGQRFYRADVYDRPAYRDAPDRELAVRVPYHTSPTMDGGHFAEDASTGVYRGFTVLTDVLQIAFMMGCHEVFVIGCDLDYHGVHTHIYGSGALEQSRRDVMPIDRVQKAMGVAAGVFRAHGRTLANAGAGGRLETLPRVPFESLFTT